MAARPDTAGSSSSPRRLLRTISNTGSSRSRGPSPSDSGHVVNRQDAPPPPIDPLSQQILQRTNGGSALYPNLAMRPATSDGASANEDARAQTAGSMAPPGPLHRTETNDSARRDLKKGVKAVAFLGRLIGSKKKENEDQAIDDKSVYSDTRPEGAEAHVFAEQVDKDNMSYSPRHPQPPAYIKVRARNKPRPEFDRLFLAQELHCSKRRRLTRVDSNKLRRKSSATPEQHTVWAMEFSRDGKYLAAAGNDMIVRVWQVLSSSDDRRRHEMQESDSNDWASIQPEHLSAPVFQSKPIKEFEGHTSTILDLSWSKNNFLLSSSMDKSVRLWHVSRPECLCAFKHNDFVPSIAFHPKDDRFFLAGSLDARLRLWSIPDKSVAYSAKVPDMITAVAFTPDGKYAIAGCLNGQCNFYETEGLKYQTQLHVRSSRGTNARGSKITAIQAHYGPSGEVKLLITSNDSRVRLYNIRDKNLELKFKGNENNSSQIRASLSDDGRYVVSGSEDRKAYIWSMHTADGDKREKRPLEIFDAHDSITTCVCFAPIKTRQLLGKSEDPVYDLCNPPPVTLMSRAERAGSQSSSRPPTESGSVLHTPAEFERPKESAGYVKRSAHNDGNIVVTADYHGMIKVFRQDCAWRKRRIDDWDRASLFGKRGGRSSRSGSVATKASQPSLRDGRTSATSQVASSDRILSWRQGISSSSNIATGESSPRSKASNRSQSPRKSLSQAPRPESHLRSATNTTEESPPSTAPTSLDVPERQESEQQEKKDDASKDPLTEPLMLNDNGQSSLFYGAEVWKQYADRAPKKPPHFEHEDNVPPDSQAAEVNGHLAVRPPLSGAKSYVSELSDEQESEVEEDDDDRFSDAQEERPEERMTCRRCGGLGFQARRVKEGVKLVCQACGLHVDEG